MRLMALLLILLSVVALATAGCVRRDVDPAPEVATNESSATATERVTYINGVRCDGPLRDVVVLDWTRPDGATETEGSTTFTMPENVTRVDTQLRADASAGEWSLDIEGPRGPAFTAHATSIESHGDGLHNSINLLGGGKQWTGDRAAGEHTLTWTFTGASIGFGLSVIATVC